MNDKVAQGCDFSFDTRLEQARTSVAKGRTFRLTVGDLRRDWEKRFRRTELEQLVISKRTLARRKVGRNELSNEETDRAMRLARVQAEADRVFANREKASRWMRTARAELCGQTPLDILKTEAGAALVQETLARIDHGIFA